MPATTNHLRIDDATYDAYSRRGHAARAGGVERPRTRRGGPRAPLPLLPLIGLAAGVGIAYVSQTAHLTQTSYQQSALSAEQSQLRRDDARLGDELARLRSPERIAASAQRLGLRPPQSWAYVASVPAPIGAPAAPVDPAAPVPGGDPVHHVVEAMSGSFGSGGETP